jgi:regulator of sirC expression with transglutaminase-like and TPR domain
MLAPEDAKAQFSSLAKSNPDDIDLIEGAILIAASLGSQVTFDECLAQLDRLASRVKNVYRDATPPSPPASPRGLLAALNQVLFVEAGFQGNEENYYDPENSFINRVLERRTGLPITLSVVYIEVARRAGINLRGIGLPGHFVVGYFEDENTGVPDIVVDPFNGGQYLSLRECEAIVHGMSFGTEETARWLRPVPTRLVLSRILSNLKQVYSSQGITPQLTTTIELMLALDPEAGTELKERAFLSYRAGKFGQAYADIKQCLDITPKGADRDQLNYYRRLFERLSVSHN